MLQLIYNILIQTFMDFTGVRQLCMIGQQTVSCALLSTLLFGGLSWRRENACYPAIMLLVVGFECLSFGRNRELAVKLGGTCAALAIIAPTTVAKFVILVNYKTVLFFVSIIVQN